MTGLNRILLYPPDSVNAPIEPFSFLYPLMFETSDVLLITKTDTLPYFDFDLEACIARVRKLNPKIRIFPLSAVTGEGCAAWEDWLRGAVRDFR